MLTTRKYLFGTTVLAGVLTLAAPAFAQSNQPAQDEESTQVEEIVVTGSRIRRDPTTSPTPLQQVSRETLLTSGQNTVIDYLATIPALAQSTIPSDTVGSLNAGGLALANLRALGSGRTLTLVDGRRHVGAPQGSLAVDIDTIPRLLIESVEIVTGGASSVYGADAVSGVLNFVLRKDFEGLEIDGRWGQINDGGQDSARISALVGKNFFDDRLNVYAFGEYEQLDEVLAADIDWLADGWGLVGRDADPAATPYDGIRDAELYRDRRGLQLLRWGQATLANNYQPSALNNPNIVPTASCTGGSATFTLGSCYSVAPGSTYIFDNGTARTANFGDWVQQTGTNRVINVGGDGENPNTIFNVDSTLPQSKSARFQVGANFAITPDINLYAEAKYVDETTDLANGYSFGDIYIGDFTSRANSQQLLGAGAFIMQTDNAFLPTNLRDAILANRVNVYGPATATTPGQIIGTAAAPYARYSAWLLDRPQHNERQVQRYVLGLNGNAGDISFLKNVDWDIGYTYGKSENYNEENGYNYARFSYAMDSIRNAQGQIVCRVQALTAGGGTVTNRNPNEGGVMGASHPDVAGCVPLNVFGIGAQSPEALEYIRARLNFTQENEQHDLLGSVAAQLWDFWGAGPIGVAVGYEYRKESTVGGGRSASQGTQYAQLNTGPDFLPAEYDTNEFFGEISIPLLRDTWLGDYAELSGSYRQSDFSTFGKNDVYGVNLVYRPTEEIAFKSSLNTSVRAPTLGESYAPFTQTFLLFTDPCATANIQAQSDTQIRANRVANCTALAAQLGLTFNFVDPTAANAYRPDYGSSVPGRSGGNPFLVPEESESFTFSTVLTPNFAPNLSLVFDYFEIQIDNVIATVSAQTAGNNCVNGPTLNTNACVTLTRTGVNDPNTPRDDRFLLVDFIQSSINYAKRNVRGMDFTANYRFDTDEMLGRNWGVFNYSLNGTWLIEQKNFNNIDNPADFTELASIAATGGSNPRVRLSQNITWRPIEALTLGWTMDWQTAQDLIQLRTFITNGDQRDPEFKDTGNFARHDFSASYQVRDDLTVRAAVTNAFDAEQARWLGSALYSNFDPYGRRFSVSLNYRPW